MPVCGGVGGSLVSGCCPFDTRGAAAPAAYTTAEAGPSGPVAAGGDGGAPTTSTSRSGWSSIATDAWNPGASPDTSPISLGRHLTNFCDNEPMSDSEHIWPRVLERLRPSIDADEYRRWFSNSSQASDSGDQITIWVPAMADIRHITLHYIDRIHRELDAMDRRGVTVRFVATGYEDDEDEWEE